MVVVYTEFWNNELLLSGKVEMKAGKYGAGGFAKFVASCSSKLLIPH